MIDVVPEGLIVRRMVEGLSFEELQSLTGAKLTQDPTCQIYR